MVFVDNAIDPQSGTIRAKAEFSNPDHFLTPGMFGRARLLASDAYQAMLIPDESIITDQTRRLVYVVDAGGKVAAREVETGPLVIGLRVIRSGMKAGGQGRARRSRAAAARRGSRGDAREAQAARG